MHLHDLQVHSACAHMYAPFPSLPIKNITTHREGTNIIVIHVILIKGGSHWFSLIGQLHAIAVPVDGSAI